MSRSTPLSRQLEDLRSEGEALQEAQDLLSKVARLQASLSHCGLKVLGNEGAARNELGRVVKCELCGDLVTVKDSGTSSAWRGSRTST